MFQEVWSWMDRILQAGTEIIALNPNSTRGGQIEQCNAEMSE